MNSQTNFSVTLVIKFDIRSVIKILESKKVKMGSWLLKPYK